MRDLYIKNGQGFIIVYSVTSKQSFQDIKLIREQIIKVKGTERVPIVIAANKCDLVGVNNAKREVSTEEGLDVAKEWNVPYVETTAKNSSIVNSLFAEIVKEINLKLISHTHNNCSRKEKKRFKRSVKTSKGGSSKSSSRKSNDSIKKKVKEANGGGRGERGQTAAKLVNKRNKLSKSFISCCFPFKKLRLGGGGELNIDRSYSGNRGAV